MRKTRLFHKGDVIADQCGKLFGVLDIEKKDDEMSRYLLYCFADGAEYSNMPHYMMTLHESWKSIQARIAD